MPWDLPLRKYHLTTDKGKSIEVMESRRHYFEQFFMVLYYMQLLCRLHFYEFAVLLYLIKCAVEFCHTFHARWEKGVRNRTTVCGCNTPPMKTLTTHPLGDSDLLVH